MHSHRKQNDKCHQIVMVVASWSITLTSSSSNFLLPLPHPFHLFIAKGITQFYHFSSLFVMKFLSILKLSILKFPFFYLKLYFGIFFFLCYDSSFVHIVWCDSFGCMLFAMIPLHFDFLEIFDFIHGLWFFRVNSFFLVIKTLTHYRLFCFVHIDIS
jgi:hypothetical protein